MKTTFTLATLLAANVAFAADFNTIPGKSLLNHDCSRPLESCSVPTLAEVQKEEQDFLAVAPARKAHVLGEIDRWHGVVTKLLEISKTGRYADSSFTKLYLDMAARVDVIAADKKTLEQVQADADLYATPGAYTEAFAELVRVVTNWNATIDNIKAYQSAMAKLAALTYRAQNVEYNYKGDMQHEVVLTSYFWNSDGAWNPVRKLQTDISKYLVMTCDIYSAFTPQFYIVGLEAHATTLAEGAEGFTLTEDAGILRKMIDGPDQFPHPMEYRCPVNNRTEGRNKASYWYDGSKNLFVDDMQKYDPGFFSFEQPWYSPTGADIEVNYLLRRVFGD